VNKQRNAERFGRYTGGLDVNNKKTALEQKRRGDLK
jgi:hypothetical protein